MNKAKLYLIFACLGAAASYSVRDLWTRLGLAHDEEDSENKKEEAGGHVRVKVSTDRKMKELKLEIDNGTDFDIDLHWSEVYYVKDGQVQGAFAFSKNNRRSTEAIRPDPIFAGKVYTKVLIPYNNISDTVIPPVAGSGMLTSQVITSVSRLGLGRHGIMLTYSPRKGESTEKRHVEVTLEIKRDLATADWKGRWTRLNTDRTA